MTKIGDLDRSRLSCPHQYETRWVRNAFPTSGPSVPTAARVGRPRSASPTSASPSRWPAATSGTARSIAAMAGCATEAAPGWRTGSPGSWSMARFPRAWFSVTAVTSGVAWTPTISPSARAPTTTRTSRPRASVSPTPGDDRSGAHARHL